MPEDASVAEHDRLLEQAILELLLQDYPAWWSREELIRQLAPDQSDFAQRDQIQNALRDLVGHGLLHRQAEFYFATRAAVHATRLN